MSVVAQGGGGFFFLPLFVPSPAHIGFLCCDEIYIFIFIHIIDEYFYYIKNTKTILFWCFLYNTDLTIILVTNFAYAVMA